MQTTKNANKKRRFDGRTMKRLLGYVMQNYKFRFIFVFAFIALSAVANVAGSLFLKTLIDDYITPLLLEANPVFDKLLGAILVMAAIYLTGVVSALLYNRMMVSIAQGTLKKIRDEMFAHMQTLQLRYFDTHSHGDVMSCYTNDTDTLRDMISQSIPQVFSSVITIVAVLAAMFYTSWILTLLVLVYAAVMILITGRIGGKSSRYFMKQQMS